MVHLRIDLSILLPLVEMSNLNLQNARYSFLNNNAKVLVLKFQN